MLEGKIRNSLTLKIKVKVTDFQIRPKRNQGQDHQLSNSFESFMRSIHGSSLKAKFQMIQKFTRNQTENDTDDSAKNNISHPVGREA